MAIQQNLQTKLSLLIVKGILHLFRTRETTLDEARPNLACQVDRKVQLFEL